MANEEIFLALPQEWSQEAGVPLLIKSHVIPALPLLVGIAVLLWPASLLAPPTNRSCSRSPASTQIPPHRGSKAMDQCSGSLWRNPERRAQRCIPCKTHGNSLVCHIRTYLHRYCRSGSTPDGVRGRGWTKQFSLKFSFIKFVKSYEHIGTCNTNDRTYTLLQCSTLMQLHTVNSTFSVIQFLWGSSQVTTEFALRRTITMFMAHNKDHIIINRVI